VIIASRFNGPPGTGNGGYAAGLVASHMDIGTPVEVTLRLPPPLDTELTVRAGDVLRVYAGAELVAEATAEAMTDDEIVAPASFDQAVSASSTFRGFAVHPFPTCFVCGPDREPGDGLRLFPGMLPDGRTAAPFVAPPDVSPVLLWAALDCPGGWSVPLEARPYVLGRMTALVTSVPAPGERCVVMGQMLGEEGRKAFVRSTLFGPAGDVLAAARATWLAL
jgi:hypothetical protein